MVRHLLLPSCLVLATAATADARSEKVLDYAREKIWPTAVRYLAVDEHAKLVDKDADTGYVVFEVTDEKAKKTYRGTLELVAVTEHGRSSVRCVIAFDDRPAWTEVGMLMKLEQKVRAEHGPPPPAPKAPPKPKQEPPPADAPKKPDDGGPPISPTP